MSEEKRIVLRCSNQCGFATTIVVPDEKSHEHIELPVNGHTQVCRADGRCWLEYVCDDCCSEDMIRDFVRKGITG